MKKTSEEISNEQLILIGSMYPLAKKILVVWKALLEQLANLMWYSVAIVIGLITIIAFAKALWFVAFVWKF